MHPEWCLEFVEALSTRAWIAGPLVCRDDRLWKKTHICFRAPGHQQADWWSRTTCRAQRLALRLLHVRAAGSLCALARYPFLRHLDLSENCIKDPLAATVSKARGTPSFAFQGWLTQNPYDAAPKRSCRAEAETT